MRVAAIEVSGFRGFAQPVEIDLDADAVIVTGANGRGKTSLFDAILWALCGMIPRLQDDSRKVVSLYSESGEASVVLHLRTQGGLPYRIRRAFDGEHEHLQVEAAGEVLRGEGARFRLLQDLWPNALATPDSGRALADAITRGVYLQQDLVRQFIEADSDHEKFRVVSELVGSGRVTELQAQLESSRKAWSTATNARKKEEETLRGRLLSLENELSSLSSDSEGESHDSQGVWHAWWTRARELGVVTGRPAEASAAESAQALDVGVKQLQALRRAAERKRDLASQLVAEVKARAGKLVPDRNALLRALEAAKQKTRAAREALHEGEIRATERRSAQIERRERREELKTLAQLALRHLGERCPVCTQRYDPEVVRRHLEGLIRAAGDEDRTTDNGEEVTRAGRHLAECERAEVVAQAALRETDLAVAQESVWFQERDRRLVELGLRVEAEEAANLLERLSRDLLNEIGRLKEHEAKGEELALGLARAGERARRVELQRQIAGLRRELNELQGTIASRNQTGRLVEQILDGLRDTASEVVSAKYSSIEPLLKRIYARIDPHPAFRDAELRTWLSYGRGRMAMRLYDPVTGVATESPLGVLSSSQMNALAVSVFLAFNLGMSTLPLRAAILDDPLQSLDDVNLLGLSDVLRRTKDRRQLFVSTHDDRFGQLLERKLRPMTESQRTRLIELEAWNRKGPSVKQTDVLWDARSLRIVAGGTLGTIEESP